MKKWEKLEDVFVGSNSLIEGKQGRNLRGKNEKSEGELFMD